MNGKKILRFLVLLNYANRDDRERYHLRASFLEMFEDSARLVRVLICVMTYKRVSEDDN